ncbi:MAG: hypothetical protein DRP57_11495 [Spirochaetes bacterium]|nr:MAG: hypothetical protein DRP57_11495 [Spirochaetota bacterium]
MRLKKYSFFIIILLGMIPVILSSCSSKILGYGVILWKDKNVPFKTGAIVKVVEESHIRKTYIVEKNRKEKVEIPIWDIKLFEDAGKAAAYTKSYKPNYNLFGFALRDGLPIREKPKTESPRKYKLRKGEPVKILRREAAKVKVGSYEDYWYYVMAKDGTKGYSFGYFLKTFSTEGDPLKKVTELMSQDPNLDFFLKNNWRPEYYKEMIDKGLINLKEFRSDIGLFPDRKNSTVTLITEKYLIPFHYSEIEKIGENHYTFNETDLRVVIYGKGRVVVSYKVGNQNISAVYVTIDKDIQEVIANEKARRNDIFAGLVSLGSTLKSDFYGTINLLEGRRFQWYNFTRLKGIIVKKDVSGTGTIDFPYFLSGKLKTDYDGIITFKFSEAPDTEINFLYRVLNGGIRLVFIKEIKIENLEVQRVTKSSVVMFFKFTKGK